MYLLCSQVRQPWGQARGPRHNSSSYKHTHHVNKQAITRERSAGAIGHQNAEIGDWSSASNRPELASTMALPYYTPFWIGSTQAGFSNPIACRDSQVPPPSRKTKKRPHWLYGHVTPLVLLYLVDDIPAAPTNILCKHYQVVATILIALIASHFPPLPWCRVLEAPCMCMSPLGGLYCIVFLGAICIAPLSRYSALCMLHCSRFHIRIFLWFLMRLQCRRSCTTSHSDDLVIETYHI